MKNDLTDLLQFDRSVATHLGNQIREKRFCMIGGSEFFGNASASSPNWQQFADCWNGLTMDRHMGDNGTYRLRRYGEFELNYAQGTLRQLPHGPYVQSLDINALNGGCERLFDPLEQRFIDHPVFEGLLRFLARVGDAAQGSTGDWNIRLHPYRIEATALTPGNPTPEGTHRDGVDYIATVMVKRQNVKGGETTVTDQDGHELQRTTLREPMDILIADDRITMHGVSTVARDDVSMPAHRDVLVVALTRPA